MQEDFKKGEFNLVQVVKLTIMVIGGSIIAGSLVIIVIQLENIMELLSKVVY